MDRRFLVVAVLLTIFALSGCQRRDISKSGTWTGDTRGIKFKVIDGIVQDFSISAPGRSRTDGYVATCDFALGPLDAEIANNAFHARGTKTYQYPSRESVGYSIEATFNDDNTVHGYLETTSSGGDCSDISLNWSAEKDSWTEQRKAERKTATSQLPLAARAGDSAEVKRLLGAGADAGMYGSGSEALLEAVQRDDREIAKLLLDAGASPTLQALELARSHKNKELFALLESHVKKDQFEFVSTAPAASEEKARRGKH